MYMKIEQIFNLITNIMLLYSRDIIKDLHLQKLWSTYYFFKKLFVKNIHLSDYFKNKNLIVHMY